MIQVTASAFNLLRLRDGLALNSVSGFRHTEAERHCDTPSLRFRGSDWQYRSRRPNADVPVHSRVLNFKLARGTARHRIPTVSASESVRARAHRGRCAAACLAVQQPL